MDILLFVKEQTFTLLHLLTIYHLVYRDIHLMLFDIGPRRVNPFNAGTVFRRSILTSKTDPSTEKSLNIYTGRRPIAIQMKQKEL